MQKYVDLANLARSFSTLIQSLFAKIGVDTAGNDLSKFGGDSIHLFIHLLTAESTEGIGRVGQDHGYASGPEGLEISHRPLVFTS